MLLESVKHVGSCFVTLTYAPGPVRRAGSDLWSLDPRDVQLWLKRLRKAVAPRKIRYFVVGEYGDQTERPHYHAIIFGLHPAVAGGSDGRGGVVSESWGLGHTFVGELTPQSAAYVGGYVTKKMTRVDDARLKGRYPEFARMSLRPGIGATAVPDIARSCSSDGVLDKIVADGDVPSSLQCGRSGMPLGRYLRRVLRKELGFAEDGCPKEVQEKLKLEMLVLLEADGITPESSPAARRLQIGAFVVDRNKQKVLNLEARTKLFGGRKVL